jgi:hypothetical protein
MSTQTHEKNQNHCSLTLKTYLHAIKKYILQNETEKLSHLSINEELREGGKQQRLVASNDYYHAI